MRIFEAIPPRPLKPGQSARITDKDSRELAAKIKSYIQTHRLDSSKLDRLEYQLTHSDLYPLSPAQIEEIKQEIESLKKANDPKVQGYDKIINQVVPIIQTRCSKYLPSLLRSQFFLYRGMGPNEHKNRLAFRANSRVNRVPTDSDVMAQRMFDKTLQELGYTALRSNSIFTSSNLDSAKAFGTAYLIFPTNDATFIWSKTKADIILKINRLEDCRETNMDLATACSLVLDQIEELESSGELTDGERLAIQYTKNTVNKQEISPTDVKHLISFLKQGYAKKFNEYEILDILNSLYNFSLEEQNKVRMGKFNLDIFKFQDKYKITDKEFPEALNTGHEILINGEYIAVLATFESLLRKALTSNQTITEAKPVSSAVPAFPKVAPGTTKAVPKLEKFGKLVANLNTIRQDIAYYTRLKNNGAMPASAAKELARLTKQEKALSAKEKSADDVIRYISTHCSKYMEAMQTARTLLYRGINPDESKDRSFFVGHSREGRLPLDSNATASKSFNQALEQLGFEARRDNSIFTKAMKSTRFGTPYVIFPEDSAVFTYTNRLDLVLHNGDERDWMNFSFGGPEADKVLKDGLAVYYNKLVDALDKINSVNSEVDYMLSIVVYNLRSVLSGGMEKLKDVYNTTSRAALTGDNKNKIIRMLIELNKFLEPYMAAATERLDTDKFIKLFKPSNTNLEKALSDGIEIYFKGPYVAMRASEFDKFLNQKILGKV